MTADTGREAVYAAEVAAFEGTAYESTVPFDELVALTRELTESEWWPHGAIEVRPARSDAGSSATRQRGTDTPVIRLAGPQTTAATLIHELAHVLAGVGQGHGAGFRRAHVDLAEVAFDARAAAWLIEAYAAMGLELGPRAWPPPSTDAPSRAVAL